MLISILSGSLSIMNMTAFAQSSTADVAAPSQFKKGDDGVLTKIESKKFENAEGSDMLSSITMIAIGAIAAKMAFTYNPKPMDVIIAAAGGAAYIGGEVYSNFKNKNSLEEMTKEITTRADGKKDQAQIDSLEELKKSYQEAKKTTESKQMMQKAAAVAFGAAAATAAYLAYQQAAAATACSEALAACVKTAAAASPILATCESGIVSVKSIEEAKKARNFSATKAATVTPLTSGLSANLSVVPPPVAAACSSYLVLDQTNNTLRPVLGLVDNGNSLLNKILFGSQMQKFSYEQMQSKKDVSENFANQLMHFFMPEAQASWMPMLGLGAGAMAAYMLVVSKESLEIDLIMYTPLHRIALWGVLAGLAYASASGSQSQIDKIQSNIDKIDKILKELNNLAKGIAAQKIQEMAIKPTSIRSGFNTNSPLDFSNSPTTTKTDCIASAGSSNCKSLETQMTSMPEFANLPDTFKSLGIQAAKMGDGLSGQGSISGATQLGAASLAGKQNAVAKLLSKVQAKLNNQLAQNGKAAIDFGAEQRNLLNGLNGKTAAVLKSKGMSAGNFLSSMGSTPISGGASAVDEMGKKSTGASSAGVGSEVVGSAARGAKDKDFDLNFKEAPANPAAAAADEGPVNNEVYDIGTNDINTNSGESIFQLISNRYLKSGYSKLLEEIPAQKVNK